MVSMKDSVAIIKHTDDIATTLEKGSALLDGLTGFQSPLIIKPNLCAGIDRTGYTNTKVDLVEAFIHLVLKKKSDLSICIVESDSEAKYADEAFDKFGYTALAQRFRRLGSDVALINLSKSSTVPVELDGLYFKNPELPRELVEAKYFVSMAVAKTHGLTFITGAMKNLFGVLPRKDKSFYHPSITEVVVDLNRCVRPSLCIVDARMGLEGWDGPRKRPIHVLLMGTFPLSVDATLARIMGFQPDKIRHLVEAEKYGLGSLTPRTVGEPPDSVMVKFAVPFHLSPKALAK
ncbi:MAG: DUF362 domain-containing protein [Candidatus Bathyarchaeota archaeon]